MAVTREGDRHHWFATKHPAISEPLVCERAGSAAHTMAPSLDSYDPRAVAPAFRELLKSTTELDADHAYGDVLEAIIHNHSGRLYAASVPAAVLLAQIVRDLTGAPQRAAIAVLIDLLSWAGPDVEFVDPHGTTIALRQSIRDAVLPLEPSLRTLKKPERRARPGAAGRLAADLLDVLHDTGPGIES